MRSRLLAIVLLCAGSCAPQAPGPGRLLLSNPDFPLINVEAVITANPDCDARDDGYVSTLEFTMPKTLPNSSIRRRARMSAGAEIETLGDQLPGDGRGGTELFSFPAEPSAQTSSIRYKNLAGLFRLIERG